MPESAAGLTRTLAAQLHAWENEGGPRPRVGRFEIERRLGEGGMGAVFLAHDPELDRQIALKILHVREGSEQRARLTAEARALARLNHPNVLIVHELGSQGDDVWLATEYVAGGTLRAWRTSHPFASWAEVVRLLVAAARGLAAAHQAGVVHCDFKPDNIMVGEGGRVRVGDFGLARVDNTPGGALSSSPLGSPVKPSFTPIGGTPGYMAPEILTGATPGPLADQYSFFASLREVLGPETRDTWPSALGGMIQRGMAATPADRWPSLQLVVDALEALVQVPLAGARDEAPAVLAGGRDSDAWGATKHVAATEVQAQWMPPRTQYAHSGDVNIAYQVLGDGPLDLVFVMGWVSHLEWFWKEPSFARFLRRLASFSRLILFDKRGTGLSDRVAIKGLPTLEQRMDDVRAVMDAVGSQRAVLCGVSEGGPMCSLFAATYPERTIALVLIGVYARRIRSDDYPWAPTPEERQRFFDVISEEWGGPVGLETRAPSAAHDRDFREWWASYLRMGASPGAALALTRMNAEIDVRPVLPTISAPTLVLHRTGDLCIRVEEGRYLAERIPGARLVEQPGDDHLPFVGDQEAMLSEIERFVTGVAPAEEPDRVLATILCLDLEPPDPGASRYLAWQRAEVARFRGKEIQVGARRLIFAFDGPARAIQCARAMAEHATQAGVVQRAGLHTGECDAVGEALSGFAVEMGVAVAAGARHGEVLVSQTVKDLVAGSGLRFEDRGESELPGELGSWRLYAVIEVSQRGATGPRLR